MIWAFRGVKDAMDHVIITHAEQLHLQPLGCTGPENGSCPYDSWIQDGKNFLKRY